ncbi:MAG: UDP-N-acetylmuramoyl-L-alanine--D-glutamate ligase [Clostridiales bacterium]|nr:UDP-N-acetylmuramoyl-L-alanine--D-glutamate ligase [Clostridiales bacterium]
MYPDRQTFLVFGLSCSGIAASEFLLKKQANVYLYDETENPRIAEVKKALEEKGAKSVEREELSRVEELCDVLVLSPGIPIDHPLAIRFKRAGRAVVGESELAVRYMKNPMIAVTGTNGKTTTVSMIADILNKGGKKAYACGNIGAPMVNYCEENEGIAVAEISSFQLETLHSHQPHIAVFLNVTEDHLNRHYNMENYLFLKGKLLKNLTAAEYAVLNYDDPAVRAFAEKTRAQKLFFSVKERVRGAYYEKGELFFGKEKILSVSSLPSSGIHNVQNALAAIITAKLMGIKTEDIVSGLTSFKGIKHRIEEIGEVDGVLYIDDSKGTNIDATIKAVETMQRETVLLLGGQNKGYDYKKLFSVLKDSLVVHAIVYGENRYALLEGARLCGYEKITLCEGFAFAVRVAALKAKAGQAVLLSPASASFDEFANYEERGDTFVEIVQSFAVEKGKGEPMEKGTVGVEESENDE